MVMEMRAQRGQVVMYIYAQVSAIWECGSRGQKYASWPPCSQRLCNAIYIMNSFVLLHRTRQLEPSCPHSSPVLYVCTYMYMHMFQAVKCVWWAAWTPHCTPHSMMMYHDVTGNLQGFMATNMFCIDSLLEGFDRCSPAVVPVPVRAGAI